MSSSVSSSGLISQPLKADGAFNWIYLTDWIVNGVLCLFFLFYFNRLFATVLLYGARLYLWRSLKVYLDIQALQISPLAGRIFFKGIRYHGDNETIYVHGGYITWRYWLRSVKECQIFHDIDDDDGNVNFDTRGTDSPDASPAPEKLKPAKQNDALPCRISVKVSGVEAFLYNRSPAYDAIIDGIDKAQSKNEPNPNLSNLAEKKGNGRDPHGKESYGVSSSASSSPQMPNPHKTSSWSSETTNDPLKLQPTLSPQSSAAGYTSKSNKPAPPAFLRLLPIHVECNKAAAVLGNENTKSIITAKIDSASGEFDASESGPLDIFKILMAFHATHPYIQMKPNVDFKTPQLDEAAVLKTSTQPSDNASSNFFFAYIGSLWARTLKSLRWSKMPLISLWPRGSAESVAARPRTAKRHEGLPFVKSDVSGNGKWLGLLRYLNDDENDEHDEWGPVEYAKSSVLADINAVDFKFYWDIPGIVPLRQASNGKLTAKDNINGASAPEYGMELIVHGGQVNYGPWADRHRIILQQIFFPAPFADAAPTESLRPGQTRLFTVFNLSLHVKDDVVLRIPFRESSKDAKWKGRAAAVTGNRLSQGNRGGKRKGRSRRHTRNGKRQTATSGIDVRPFAWFDIRVGNTTTVNYSMDMYPGKTGYRNKLKADVSSIDIFSSLNHGLLWHCQRVGMECDLSNPLAWNGLRSWVFNMNINRLDFFLLRDHTFLLVDLIEDWSSGPQPDFYTFAPYRYRLNVHFQDYKLYLNTNDANIVDNADSLEDNEFVILYGRTLDADLLIPLDRLRPVDNAIKFEVGSTELGFELCMPPKNTLSELLTHKDVAQLSSVNVNGAYTYCSEVRAGLTETLNLEIIGKSLRIDFYGFLARQLAKIKENYFGESVHFRTLNEYQDLVRRDFEGADSEHPVTKSNDLDVILDITAEDVNILLPCGLYDSDEHVKIRVDKADVDLRVNNYYLELMVNSNPLELSCTARPQIKSTLLDTSGTQLFLDGIKVFGHRLFGLSPSEPPYVSNWDVDAGAISGECSTAFVEKTAAAAQSFALTIADAENAVPLSHYLPLYDSTFVRFACPDIQIWCRSEQRAFLVSTGRVSGSFNDLAGRLFSQQLSMAIPNLTVACVDADGLLRHRNQEQRIAKTFAYFKTTISMSMVRRSLGFKEQKRLQQGHIHLHDARRGERAPFLVQDDTTGSIRFPPISGRKDTLSLDLPSLPTPMASYHENAATLDCGEVLKPDNSHFADRSQVESPKYAAEVAPELKPAPNHGRYSSFSQGISSSAVAFSSPFKAPQFSLQGVEPDLADVPINIPTSQPIRHPDTSRSYEVPLFDSSIDEDTVHTAFIVSAAPGITAFCTPEAVRSVAAVVEQIQPKYPSQVLDDFHFKTINEVVASYVKRRGNNSLVDLSINLPQVHLRFVNHLASDSQMVDAAMSDRYNAIANDITVSVRLKTVPTRQHEADANSMHATLGSLKILAEEGSTETEKEHAAFTLNIDDVLVWLVDSDRTSVHASFHTTEIATTSKKVEYLANLIHRTTMLVNEFQSQFAEILQRQHQRLKYLFYNLTTLAEQTQDPSFLTRPSYVIRSSPDHMRNSDSWKILSRIRYNLLRLNAEKKEHLVDGCINKYFELPNDAETSVLAKLDQWRSWDAVQAKESFAVRIVYGSMADVEKLHDRSRTPIGVTVRALSLRVVVDPGVKQNELIFEQLAVGLAISPPPPPSALQLFKDVEEVKSTVVQLNITKYTLGLNWNVFELVDHVLVLFERRPLANPQHKLQARDLGSTDSLNSEEFHVVLSSESGLIRLETINITQSITTVAPRVSITGTGWNPICRDKTVNVMISANQTVLESHGHERLLCLCKIISPTMWFAYTVSAKNSQVDESFKIAGDSKDISLQVKDEIIGLIEVAHSFVSDEVAYIHRLTERHKQSGSPTAHHDAPSLNDRRLHVSLALFLNIYTIELALLNDVTYSSGGRTVSLSVAPDSKDNSTYQMDYDLKAQTHRLLTGSSLDQTVVATLEMPPINGTLQLVLSQSAITASGLLTIEKIFLDGAALYGILNVLSPARVQPAFEAIKSDALAVQEKVNSIYPKVNVTRARKQGKPRTINFDTGVVLAGIAISADAPPTMREASTSNILFDIQRIHVRASNRTEDENACLPFPEIRLAMQEISIELRQFEGDALRLSGKMSLNVQFNCTVKQQPGEPILRDFGLFVVGPEVEINAETAPLLIDVMVYLQERMKGLDLSKEKGYLRRLRHSDRSETSTSILHVKNEEAIEDRDAEQSDMQSSFSFDLESLMVTYVIDDSLFKPVSQDAEDLVLTLKSVRLLASNQADARLNIEDLQLALVPQTGEMDQRPRNSALLPEMIFNVAQKTTKTERKLVFQAAGKTLDLQLDPRFMLPVSDLERSITLSSRKARKAAANLKIAPSSGSLDKKKLFGTKDLSSLTIDADFAGTVVRLQAAQRQEPRRPTVAAIRPQHGRYGQFAGDNSSTQATLRAPGIALKIRYEDNSKVDPSLSIECKVDGSSNVLHPAVVPLILQISDSVKKVVREPDEQLKQKSNDSNEQYAQKAPDEDSIVQADPRTVLGKTRLNLGIRICKQEFSLSCQPIAKVDASAKLEDIYITVNNIESEETGHFFAASAAIRGLKASLKHVYSREATFSFDIESIVLSLMNSKHISGTSGISAILKINPTRTEINAKQLQDVLLFREIWLPPEVRHGSKARATASSNEPQDYFVQRYQQVAAAAAFPWNATIAIAELKLDVDLGQSIGKTSLRVVNLWACSKKTTSSRQNLCVGIDEVGMSSSGRMSGFIDLEKVKVRTSIAWPEGNTVTHTPLIQGAIGFDQLRVKAAFDYQAFAVANISSFEFLMYNVRDVHQKSGDRLVAILDGDKVSVYCIAASAAHGLSLAQAFERLVQEKQASYEQALKDIEKFLRRRPSVFVPRPALSPTSDLINDTDESGRTPISLHTDVIVTLRALDVGAFPSTLLDRQVLRGEASDVQTRFAVTLEEGKIHSGLGLTLGQLRVALASVAHPSMPKTLGEITIEEVIRNATTAKGGVILRVPKVVAAMQTWQGHDSNIIDYIFKSSFEGKIDVGWNYSRISFIRGMWGTHSRTFVARLGKPLPEPAVKITGAPKAQDEWGVGSDEAAPAGQEQQKITAEVSLPQSKYIYRAMEPPIIETPQLRDMGEATPPLEWVGLHRDRLPNVTHQIVIVTLLELSKEVEDAYSRILGSA